MPTQSSRRGSVRALAVFSLVALSLGLIVFFSLRALRDYRRLQDELQPGATDVERIRGWMTVPYIARAYDVPPAPLFAALGVPGTGDERLSIRQLAAKYQRDPVEMRATIQRVILERKSPLTPPPEGSP